MVVNHDTVAGVLGRPGYWEARALKAEQALAARDATIQAVSRWFDENCHEMTAPTIDELSAILAQPDDEAASE